MKTQTEDVLPVFRPQIGADERTAVLAALDVGYLGLGPATGRFERELGSWLGLQDRHLTATNSCTEALHLAALLAGLGPGDEVICPSFTYIAGAPGDDDDRGRRSSSATSSPRRTGWTWTRVRELVTDRTMAVMSLHYAGPAGTWPA